MALASLYVLSLVSLLLVRRQRPARPGAPQLEAGAESAAGAGPEVGARQVVVADDNRFLANCQSLSTGFGLTPREAEMLPLLGQGRSAAGISKLLYISENTTKSHIRSIYRKLGVHTKQDLIERVRSVRQ
ncbi:MAG: helix-turn-helix transcriptional regulator [Bifidobacteriaceae bacterium]|nr:helix-turn-helix transcriptional regulator [Bifidobacteriaceae bacterium]